jgi:hypothetical protein
VPKPNAVSPAVSLTGPSQAGYGTPVALSGTITTGSIAPPKGATVTISRTSASTGPATQFSASTAADGSFTFTDKTHPVPGKYRYTATYGLTTSAPRTVVVSPEHAAVAVTLHGFYRTSRRGSIVYYLYHHTAKVSAAVHVTPVRPGECVRLELQEFYRGKWVGRLRTKCAALSRKGEVTTAMPAKKAAIGHPYRFRADFIPGHDITVRSADSDWQYIMTKSQANAVGRAGRSSCWTPRDLITNNQDPLARCSRADGRIRCGGRLRAGRIGGADLPEPAASAQRGGA